tara:strand:+ start:56 stop:205 length:150 start_codon:yes stop_codon:yes gene_type:complete
MQGAFAPAVAAASSTVAAIALAAATSTVAAAALAAAAMPAQDRRIRLQW